MSMIVRDSPFGVCDGLKAQRWQLSQAGFKLTNSAEWHGLCPWL